MSSRPPTDPPDDPDDDSLFAEAMEGVTPIDHSRDPVAPAKPVAPPRKEKAPRARKFEWETTGDLFAGRAEGVEASVVGRLRGGEWEVEHRIDIHGYSEREARLEVLHAVARSADSGHRCVLLVHGRGLRSADGPVLKKAVPGWLTRPPLARRVVAFTTAPKGLGGSGATLVLLRKKKAAPA
jgi:DNA-nicking Smr family endonuclease